MSDTPIIDRTLTSDGFWPVVSVRAIVEGFAVQVTGRDHLLLQLLQEAIIDTNFALQDAKAQAVADGFATLAAYAASVPTAVIDDKPEAEILYIAAVGNRVKAEHVKRRQDQQRRPTTDSEAAGADNSESYFLDRHQNAVAKLIERLAPNLGSQTVYGAHVASIGAHRTPRCHTGDSPWM